MSIQDMAPEDYPSVDVADLSREEIAFLKEQWRAKAFKHEHLPQGAVSTDSLGRTLILGIYEPKVGRDSDTGIKRMPEDFEDGREFKATVSKPVPNVRCTGFKQNGDRCNRWSIMGATICPAHGGNLPTVKKHAQAIVESARMRLIGMTDDAIDVLEDLTQVGTNDAIRLKAATEILDRVGIKGGIDINVEVEHKVNPSEELIKRLNKLAERNAVDPLELDGDVVDAEVIE